MIADQTVWSLYLNAMYSFFIGTLAFRKPADVWSDIKSTSWPALKVSWRFWPFVHCISFSHAVPLDLKLLWVDVMEIVWVTLLSRVANKDVQEGKEEVRASMRHGTRDGPARAPHGPCAALAPPHARAHHRPAADARRCRRVLDRSPS